MTTVRVLAPLTVSASSSTGYSNNGIDAVHLPPGTRAQIRRTLITDDDPVEAERMLHDLDPKVGNLHSPRVYEASSDTYR